MINVNYNAIAVASKPGGKIMSGYVDEMILTLRLYVLHHKTRIISVLHELEPLMEAPWVTCWNLDQLQ